MKLFNPGLLGILWSCLSAFHSLPAAEGQLNKKESHSVYSYSYHFQHNGSNPKDILQRILADPDFNENSDGKSVVKTIFDPSVRGFFSKGVLPAGRSWYGGSGQGGVPRHVGIDDIKKIVNSNLSPLPPPPPLPPIPPPPPVASGIPDNFLKVSDPVDILRNRPFIPPGVNEHVVTNVENFARDIPGGRVVGQIESFSYNPPPVNNAVTRSEGYARGFRYNEEVVSRNQQSTGQRSQSYFRQHFKRGGPDSNEQNRDSFFGQRINMQHGAAPQRNEWWKTVNDNSRGGVDHSGRFNKENEVNRINPHVGLGNIDNRGTNNAVRQNRANIRYNQGFNNNNVRDSNSFNLRNHANNNAQNSAYQGGINNGPVNDGHNAIGGNSVTWDDDSSRWNAERTNDWSNRMNENLRIQNNRLLNQNNGYSRPDNDRPFSNGHGGPWTNQRPSPYRENNQASHNPGEFLKSTLEALINGAKIVELNPFGNDGNYRHVDGGGTERVFGSDRVARGPNSFSRSTERGYEKNFETIENSGFQRSHRWADNNIKRLDTDTTENFSKDFIDVFQDARV